MKKIQLKNEAIGVETCESCPFKQYNPNYGMSYDSGYDCHFLDRLVDDNHIRKYEEDMNKINDQNKGLFKFNGKLPKNPFEIPEDCPLQDLE